MVCVMSYQPVYRDGKIHVQRVMCPTCIFRPGNLLSLKPGRVAEMVKGATADESCIPCHDTLGRTPAVCRGFFDRHATAPLQIASRLGLVVLDG